MSGEGPLVITGAAGFIGRALLTRLPHAVGLTRADVDLRDREATRAVFARLRPARVVHLAALTGGVAFHARRNADVLIANTQIDANVIDAAAHAGTTRLVALVSSCAYPDLGGRAVSEHDLHLGEPFAGNTGLAWAKRHLDRLCRVVSGERNVSFTTITPVTTYGPGDRAGEDAHVIAALLGRALASRATGAPLTVWGTGRAIRQFVYIDDLVSILAAELLSDDGPPNLIVAPDDGWSIAQVAGLIRTTAGLSSDAEFTGEHEGQTVKRLSSVEFARRHPGLVFTPFETGLQLTLRAIIAEGRP